MAKLLLSCDDYIFRYREKYYFKNQEWSDFYQRYLRVFDQLRVANRVIDEDELRETRVPIEDKRIEICHLPIFHGPKQYIKEYFAVGHAIRNVVEGCDAAILRIPSTVAQRVGRQVLKVGMPYAVEVVFDAHDGISATPNIFEKLLWRIIDYKMRHLCRHANGVSCVTSHYLQQRYFSLKPNHFESYYSTLNLDKSFFTSTRAFPSHHTTFKIAHVDLQIRLHARKGTDVLIRAISKLKKEGIVVNVDFAGDDWGNNKQEILNYAKVCEVEGQVSCPGFLSREALSKFLDDADLFVLPTKAEGLPRVIIEAIAKGLPTITTPVSGNPELIPEEYLVKFSDVDTLAEKIKRLVTDKIAYEKASKENFEHSLQYEGSILQSRRDEFYTKLKNCINI